MIPPPLPLVYHLCHTTVLAPFSSSPITPLPSFVGRPSEMTLLEYMRAFSGLTRATLP